MKLSKENMKAAKKQTSKTNWRDDIITYLTEDKCKHNGESVVAIFNATRGADCKSKKGLPMTDSHKAVNMSSQLYYIEQDDYLIERGTDGNHTTLSMVASPDGEVFAGAEALAKKYA